MGWKSRSEKRRDFSDVGGRGVKWLGGGFPHPVYWSVGMGSASARDRALDLSAKLR